MSKSVSNLSFNMLLVLDAMCRHKNTLRAAAELNITQPAISQYIKKLKDITGKDLFIRTHNGLEPTSECLELHQKGQEILNLGAELIQGDSDSFDPEKQGHTFTISVPQQKISYFFDALNISFREKFPLLHMNICKLDQQEAMRAIEIDMLDIYIGMLPANLPSTLKSEKISSIDLSVVCSKNSPVYKTGKITKKDFKSLPHIKVANTLETTLMDHMLESLNLLQDNLYMVPDKESACTLLEQSDHLFIVDRQSAELLCEKYKSLKVLEKNFSFPNIDIYQVWHKRYETNAAHSWLRSYINKNITA